MADLFDPQNSDMGSNAKKVEQLLIFNIEMMLQKAAGCAQLYIAKTETDTSEHDHVLLCVL